ncbi:DUF4124 domain-containing protein [Stenotrophomonas sp. HITSZ_GD]|uniref:DUF4124 domain-containing protein n=1 Tax=Stenotrophomonas sp. HITSZ_GD TaxID=3037248 RepID=UPI00240E250A|nr:DUF4124 domain-containing protein [Stenotrophomonas sp. HITSZ_GD]MDG2524220.1 DUF4124 domain-containing protein [Stenotrophomonas sp. HITSZ_GD]
MDVRALAIALLLVSCPAAAQQVYKCVKGKQVSYQSDPCENGPAAKAWDATPVPEQSNAEKWRLYRIQQELRQRNAPQPSYGWAASSPSTTSACESVKAQRDAAYAQVGLKRSFEFSSYWDNRVQQACK